MLAGTAKVPPRLVSASVMSVTYSWLFRNSRLCVGSLQPACTPTLKRVAPALPRLVVMSTTPLVAREPYMADAEASFRMVMLSISVGLISAMGLVAAVVEEMLSATTGTPSTTYKGCVPPLMLDTPRTRTRMPWPSLPLLFSMNTPAALP
jgi:hypothetical protein